MEKDLYLEMYEMETSHWWFLARKRIVLSLIDKYLNNVDHPTFLDVGCGTGAMLRELEIRGEATGIDASEKALAFASRRSGARLIEGEAPGILRESDKRYECVLLLDLLEHLEEDTATAIAAAERLKEGGIMVVTTPAFQWLFAPRDRYHHHYRRYTKRGLRAIMDATGLKTELLSYCNTLLFPAAAISRMLSRLISREPGPDLILPPPALNWILEEVFAVERFIIPRFSLPWGLSLICVGRKQRCG